MMDRATLTEMGRPQIRGDMRRRDFIRLAGAAAAIPAFSIARSQEAGRSRRIGILADDGIFRQRDIWPAFFEELSAGGYIEGTNLQVDRRGFGQQAALNTVATELVRARSDVIHAVGATCVGLAREPDLGGNGVWARTSARE